MTIAKPKATVRTSGGTPAGCPDFRPINKLPKHEVEQLIKKSIRPTLYQVWVEDRLRGVIPISPKCRYETADALSQLIATQISLGNERYWSMPTILPVV
jgi:hypothetical protein